MSFSAHKRDALDATLPLSDRMSHLRSCAMLMGQKYGVRRSAIIERVVELCGVDITMPVSEVEVQRAVEALVRIKEVGLDDPGVPSVAWPGVDAVRWLQPWEPIEGGSPDDGLSRELSAEVSPSHVLYGIKVRPVARRQDCDDVLFELLDGSGRFAVVHLTWALHPEPDTSLPWTNIYADWAEFERERMGPDAADLTA